MNDLERDKWMFWNGEQIPFEFPDGFGPVYLIGDSHVRVLGECCPDVLRTSGADIADVFHESKTAYAIGSEGHDYYLKECLQNIPDKSLVLLSFGEIDCRHYLPRIARERNVSLESLVDEVMHRYTSHCVRLLKQKFRVTIMTPYVCPDDHQHQNPHSDIVEAKSILTRRLEEYCAEHGLAVVPAFHKVLERQWDRMPPGTYFNDTSHLGPCMIPLIVETITSHWK